MAQAQMCRRTTPKTLRFHRVQEGLWHSADGQQQLRSTGPLTCMLRRRTGRGATECLFGLWSGSKVFLRDPRGVIVEVQVSMLPGDERMDWTRPRLLLTPAPDPLHGLAVEYSANTHEFRSLDGNLMGRVNLGNGRLWSEDGAREWAGLLGNGLVVLVTPGVPARVARVTPMAHAQFLLEGAGEDPWRGAGS